MKRDIGCSIFVFIALSMTACTLTLNSSVPFRYVPSLTPSEADSYRLGVSKLVDKRPGSDLESTDGISDVVEKVTATFIEDIRGSNLFSKVSYPPNKDRDDFIVDGELRRFYWKASQNGLVWVPIVNFAIYFGAPVFFVESNAGLNVRLIEARTGQTVGTYEKFASREKSYGLYDNVQAGEAGAELADCFREVVKKIKEEMLADLQKRKGAPR